jgi:hypothetical protein
MLTSILLIGATVSLLGAVTLVYGTGAAQKALLTVRYGRKKLSDHHQ